MHKLGGIEVKSGHVFVAMLLRGFTAYFENSEEGSPMGHDRTFKLKISDARKIDFGDAYTTEQLVQKIQEISRPAAARQTSNEGTNLSERRSITPHTFLQPLIILTIGLLTIYTFDQYWGNTQS